MRANANCGCSLPRAPSFNFNVFLDQGVRFFRTVLSKGYGRLGPDNPTSNLVMTRPTYRGSPAPTGPIPSFFVVP